MAVNKEQLQKLQQQKTYDELGIIPKWFPRSTKGGHAICVPYYDARDVQKVLDHICGSENWCNEPLNINGRLFMQIGINIDGEGWVYKSDVGTESNIEKVKGEASDAIKRAAVMWGIFRNTYDIGEKVLPTSGKYAATHNGKALITGEQVSAYCNNLNTEIGSLVKIYTAFKSEFEAHPDAKAHLTGLREFLKSIKE